MLVLGLSCEGLMVVPLHITRDDKGHLHLQRCRSSSQESKGLQRIVFSTDNKGGLLLGAQGNGRGRSLYLGREISFPIKVLILASGVVLF